MKERVLVLGGTGFVGRSLSTLLSTDYYVRIFSPSANQISLENGIEGYVGRIENQNELTTHLEWADIIVHLVSTSNPKSSMCNPYGDAQSNLLPLISILEYLKNHPEKYLVFCSSGGAVYGKGDEVAFEEDHPKRPQSSYGIVKSTMEEYIEYYRNLYQVNALVLRPSNIYGYKSKSLGQQGLISTLILRTLKKEPVDIWVPLSTNKDYLYIQDFVKSVKLLIENQAIGVYNIGSGDLYSISEIISVVAKSLGELPMINASVSDFSKIDVPVRLNTAKLKKLTGWEARYTLEEGVDEILNDIHFYASRV
ncbi:NAD-dependent epimerase/dehydratase family protein [Echinicola sediminis]